MSQKSKKKPATKAPESLRIGSLFRSVTFSREAVDEDARTVELSFSSEEPVERWFGYEVLGHQPGEVDLSRLMNSGAFLMDHSARDHRGAIEKAWLDGATGRAIVRLSRSERGEELFNDIKDGIRPHISVGYRILELLHVKRDENGNDWYRATKWAPYEISSVSVPADTTVGVGRSAPDDSLASNVKVRGAEMDENEVLDEEVTTEQTRAAVPAQPAASVTVEARNGEISEVREIMAIGDQFGFRDLASQALQSGVSLGDFRKQVMEKLRAQRANPAASTAMDLGLSEREKSRYSLMRAIRAANSGNWKEAGFEREISIAVAQKMGRDARGFFVNYEVLANLGRQQSVGTPNKGGYLVGTQLDSASFIDLLRPRAVTAALGARLLTGLVGNVDIPKMTAGATFYWVAEDGDITDSDATFGVVQLTPKTIGGAVPITRRLMLQSTPDVEVLIRDDLLKGMGLALDKALIQGTGVAPEPRGIINQSGIGAVDLTAGPSWADIVELETDVAAANADAESMAYLCGATMRGTLKTTLKATGTAEFLWQNGEMNGYRSEMSNQVPAGGILFGDFSQAMIGLWGAVDLMVDKSTKAASGGTVLRIFQDADTAARHAAAFSYGV